ncbi:septation protein SepH [Actinokineospora enzanensis]|uniref:septation protein SepH n=1 Tax=Actinokineospora enzanensis TaxID=155975 RepID=UPI000363945E|nr:septation protein SepH [Actinokineospora enzanensis]
MRALRVVGLSDDGKTVICEDPARGERFTLPADERLRAAARGDVTRLGQIEIELESQMRPREIQTRIRAGESVEQLAEAAGIPTHKIERFAYPVLLERSRTAELAQRAHPIREDGPDLQTLGEVVAHAFGLRGQDYPTTGWDSWRGEDGKWIVQLAWTAGRSLNRAHWSFHPGAHGGTVTPLDEHAHDLLDPQPNRPLRTVRPVTELAQAALSLDVAQPRVIDAEPDPELDDVFAPPVAPVPSPAPEPVVVAEPTQDFVEDFELTPEPVVAEAEVEPEPEPDVEPEPVTAEEPSQDALIEEPARKQAATEPSAAARRSKAKKARPIVPSWEDVLLGTRSNRG